MNNSLVVNLYPSPTGQTDERLAVSTSVVSLSNVWSSDKTKYLLIDIQGDDVMVTFDGSAPSASNGHLFKKLSAPFFWNKSTALAAKFIRSGIVDAAVQATPFTV